MSVACETNWRFTDGAIWQMHQNAATALKKHISNILLSGAPLSVNSYHWQQFVSRNSAMRQMDIKFKYIYHATSVTVEICAMPRPIASLEEPHSISIFGSEIMSMWLFKIRCGLIQWLSSNMAIWLRARVPGVRLSHGGPWSSVTLLPTVRTGFYADSIHQLYLAWIVQICDMLYNLVDLLL